MPPLAVICGFAAGVGRFPLSREWGWGGMGGLGDLGGDLRHTLPFPPRSSIPAKAGISRGGIVRHASPQAILCFRFAEFPAKAGRDSRASGNGMRGEWKGSVGGGGIKGVWGVGEKKAPGGGLLGDMGVRCPLGCLGGWTLPRGRHQKRLPFPGWK